MSAFVDLDKGTPTHHTKYHTLSKKDCQTVLTDDFYFSFFLKDLYNLLFTLLYFIIIYRRSGGFSYLSTEILSEITEVLSFENGDSFSVKRRQFHGS